ncbi:MAG TPA: amidohydrolase family protein [Mycobacteriales bacterium]|nr:amidohydrolase family protein [Mycobacteriales bacterium]
MTATASADAAVPGFWRALGLPGLVDVHVHFLPPRVLAAVWAFFDQAEEHYGRAWPILYKGTDDERLARLRGFGVRAFTGLAYPHKPGMARFLNDWTLELAGRTPDLVPSATFFPEPAAGAYVRAALEAGARVFKAHLQVGGYDPNDPLLDPVWGALAEAGTPAVVHCGDGPRPGPHTGVEPMERVLTRHPGLVLVVAHAGMPDYLGFAALADRHPRVHLDTTMLGTAFTRDMAPVPAELPARLADLGDRVVLGTDFPNIPYPYLTQLEALAELGLGEDWLRRVCWSNGVHLLGLNPDGTVSTPG